MSLSGRFSWAVAGLVLVCLIAGCARQREGQVFVVTSGRQNVKMGLVAIHAVTEDELRRISEPVARAHAKAISQIWEANARDDASVAALHALETELRSLASGLEPIPSVVRRVQATSEKRIEIEKARLARAGALEIEGNQLAERLFGALPPAKTKTDADGRFKVSARAGDWLFARSSRKVATSEETYVWAARVPSTDGDILIANDSLHDPEISLPLLIERASGVKLPDIQAVSRETPEELMSWIEEQKSAATAEISTGREQQKQARLERERRRQAEEQAAVEKLRRERQEAEDRAIKERELAIERERIESEQKELRRIQATKGRLELLGAEMREVGFPEVAITQFLTKGGSVVVWANQDYLKGPQPPAVLTDVVNISAGSKHVVAVKSDGTAIAWPKDYSGRTVVPERLDGVVCVAAGEAHNLALRYDGTVVAWGDNLFGQCDVPPGLGDVVSIAAGGHRSAAILKDGSVVSWGYGKKDVPKFSGPVRKIALGRFASAALLRTGSVEGWGTYRSNAPKFKSARNIVASDWNILAITDTGNAVIWGSVDAAVPPNVNKRKPLMWIAAGSKHYVAAAADGTLLVWGSKNVSGGPGLVCALTAGDDFSALVQIEVKDLPPGWPNSARPSK